MHRFSRYPLLRLAPPFICGCLLANWNFFSVELVWLLNIAILSLVWSVFFPKSFKSFSGVLIFISFIALGAAVSIARQSMLSDPAHYSSFSISDSSLVLLGSPDGFPKMTAYGKKMYFNLQYARINGNTKSTSGQILVHIKSDSLYEGPQPGGLYALRTKLRKPGRANMPGGFDWQNHLKNKGIFHEGWINQSDIRELKSPDGISAFTNRCRVYVEDLFISHLPDMADLGVANALLLGNENWLDNETETNFAAAGVLHVLCVSGMHLVLLYGILIKIFNPFLRKNRGLNFVVFPFLVFTIWFYSLLTGMSPSITRAATMTTFVILSEWMDKRVHKTNLMCASMILLGCLDPLMLLSTGFQLSFLAVCGIFYLHPVILTAIEPGNRFTRQIWELTSITLAAQIATFPLSLHLFGQFPNWFLLANMVIVPVSSIVMYAGMVLVILGKTPWIGEWIGYFTSLSIKSLRYLVELISSLPYAVTEDIYFPVLMVASTYGLIIMLFRFFNCNSYGSLVGGLSAIILFLISTHFRDQDFEEEDSCWIMKSKSGPVFIKQQGLNAGIVVFEGLRDKDQELKRIENTLATKRNVRSFKKTTIKQKMNFSLKQYNATYIHRFPYNWNLSAENLKSVEETKCLVLERKPYEGFWDVVEKSMPNLEKVIFLRRTYLPEKSLETAKTLGIQISNLEESGYIRL